MKNYRRYAALLILLVAAAFGWLEQRPTDGTAATGAEPTPSQSTASGQRLAQAIRERQSDVQVRGSGTVIRLLRDDNEGSRHQKFILRLPSGDTLLVAHNIDLAPRIDDLQTGDRIEFYGEYEWNDRGGVLHWTHHDPAGRHPDGWLQHKGKRYR